MIFLEETTTLQNKTSAYADKIIASITWVMIAGFAVLCVAGLIARTI